MRTTITFLIISALSISSSAQIDSLSSYIDTLFTHVNLDSPGFAVAVIRNDDFLFKKGYGLANLEHKIPINSNTNFNIASLSKQITAASVALLILEGKIKLEDHVSAHLPDFPFAEDNVKIKHLIYMTSGINDYYYNPRENGTDWSSLQFFNIDMAIAASYGSNELMYKPGSQWSYSNINYMLLTKIVEAVSGISFADFVEERIFDPLDMNDSQVNDDIFQIVPNRAMGYNYRDAENTNWMIESNYIKRAGKGFLQVHRNSAHYGGSGVYTTVEDFKKWISNFYSKEYGGQEFYDLMHQTMKFEHDKANDAFGLVMDNYEGADTVWYEGGDWGYSTFMIRFVETNTTIFCFSNLGTGNARSKVWGVYDILKGHKILE